MTAINVGPKDGLAFIPPEKMKLIRDALGRGGNRSGLKAFVNGDNYLFAGSQLGIVKRIIWIIPFRYLDFVDAEERVKYFLRNEASHFPAGEIDSLKFDNGTVSGKLAGVGIQICGPSRKLHLNDSALVNLDMSFFPLYAVQKRMNKLGAIRDFFDSIASWRIMAGSVHVISPPDLDSIYGYFPDIVKTILSEPSLIHTNSPQPVWVVRDQAENMLSGGGIKEAFEFLTAQTKAYTDDPYLAVMREIARSQLAGKAPALDNLSRLCKKQAIACRGIVDAGVMRYRSGDVVGSLEFFRKAVELEPGMHEARLELAVALYDLGRYEEASRVLAASPDLPGWVAGLFLMGDCAYKLKREDTAISQYEEAVAAYKAAGGYRLDPREQAGLERLRKLYEKEKNAKGLKLLDGLYDY